MIVMIVQKRKPRLKENPDKRWNFVIAVDNDNLSRYKCITENSSFVYTGYDYTESMRIDRIDPVFDSENWILHLPLNCSRHAR